MADYTDAYGLWIDLGTLTAATLWQTFDRPSQSGVLFRFSFFANWGDWQNRLGWRSWAWFRFAHHDDAGTFQYVEPAFKLFPKPEPMLIELPILSRLYSNPYTWRKASFKQFIDYRSRPVSSAVNSSGIVPNLPWDLKIEYLDDSV